ncbi:DNA-binding response regulator [bacterium CG17_big_fil_post_rev_8_21_14_2_50_64_8]|nr:MAG: DNA-binding response regulator [bacterium CG17_big_fil_post_rev_8_21_14_2_50_64_8]PJA73155.1 MAG: DNA-binding response regulator [bacterium CG_4_9_14_3_um_filter_65_15]
MGRRGSLEVMEPPAKTTTLVIVDDHPLVRAGIKALLHLEGDLDVVGEAEDHAEAIEVIAAVQPDLVLVDLSLKNSNGLNLIKELAQKRNAPLILTVSMHDEYTYAVRCLKAGARGYIMKQEGTERILEAIRCVLSGETYLSSAMTRNAVNHVSGLRPTPGASPVSMLSNRELELFQLTGKGLEIAEIAEVMSISPRTVEVHRSHIKKKLGLRTSTEIFQVAYDWLRDSGLQI